MGGSYDLFDTALPPFPPSLFFSRKHHLLCAQRLALYASSLQFSFHHVDFCLFSLYCFFDILAKTFSARQPLLHGASWCVCFTFHLSHQPQRPAIIIQLIFGASSYASFTQVTLFVPLQATGLRARAVQYLVSFTSSFSSQAHHLVLLTRTYHIFLRFACHLLVGHLLLLTSTSWCRVITVVLFHLAMARKKNAGYKYRAPPQSTTYRNACWALVRAGHKLTCKLCPQPTSFITLLMANTWANDVLQTRTRDGPVGSRRSMMFQSRNLTRWKKRNRMRSAPATVQKSLRVSDRRSSELW